MASADLETGKTRQEGLPMFYKSVFPLSSAAHGRLIVQSGRNFSFAAKASAIPVLSEEFAIAQRHYPVVFSTDDTNMPIALMGLQPNRNAFVDDVGKWQEGAYVPAYVRRYPFILVKKRADSEDMALCIDASARMVELGDEGNLFEGKEPSELAKSMLKFCTDYERGTRATTRLVQMLRKYDLLIDGEVKLKTMRGGMKVDGFRVVSEPRLRDLPADAAHELNKCGAMAAIHAHLLSLATFPNLPRPNDPPSKLRLDEPMGHA
ncbi:MAG: SapC family protein [Alphaproteobacteria bacterium]